MSRIKNMSRGGWIVSMVALVLVPGALFAAAVTAGAQPTSTTYYACLAGGKLTHVGTTTPSCATVISWNSQGPTGATGPAGPQGPAGATVNTCTSPPGPGLNFSVCSLTDIQWGYVDLDGTLLIATNLSGAYLDNADLIDANMTGVIMSDDTDLEGANLTGANLTYGGLDESNWGDANLTDANLTGAATSGALMGSVIWSNTICPDGKNSNNVGDTCANDM